jgi:group I intron endonuclease
MPGVVIPASPLTEPLIGARAMPTPDHTTFSDSGIYRFVCVPTGKCYVGGSGRMKIRKGEHLASLRGNRHHSRRFQNAWNKWGEQEFAYEILEECDPTALMEREQHWIDTFKSFDKSMGFNIAPITGTVLGIKRSEETKERMRVSRRNRIEKPFSEAHRVNLSKSLMGNQRTKGHKLTEEHRAKLSAASKGKPRPDVSAALKGRKFSLDHRMKISAAKRARRRRVGSKESQGMLF